MNQASISFNADGGYAFSGTLGESQLGTYKQKKRILELTDTSNIDGETQRLFILALSADSLELLMETDSSRQILTCLRDTTLL